MKFIQFYLNDLHENGFEQFVKRRIRKHLESTQALYQKAKKRNKQFSFHNALYSYFIHPYNSTWQNERTIEIPIIWDIVRKNKGKKILEFGNVLSHYYAIRHDVLDRYEKGDRVINQDVVNFNPEKKYDLIISISTFEHVGFDEKIKDITKIPKAINALKRVLTSQGKMVVTLPIGYNPVMDRLLKNKRILFKEVSFMKRISKDNRWKESSWDDVKNARYGKPYPYANAIVIAEIGVP